MATKKIRLSFRIEKEAGLHIVECPLAADQQVLDLEETYEITATVVESAMLEWWLRGFGDAVTAVHKMPLTIKKKRLNELQT